MRLMGGTTTGRVEAKFRYSVWTIYRWFPSPFQHLFVCSIQLIFPSVTKSTFRRLQFDLLFSYGLSFDVSIQPHEITITERHQFYLHIIIPVPSAPSFLIPVDKEGYQSSGTVRSLDDGKDTCLSYEADSIVRRLHSPWCRAPSLSLLYPPSSSIPTMVCPQ